MADRFRDLIDGFLEQIARDPDFRKRLRDNPQETLEASEFGRQIRALQPDVWEPAEVIGYGCEDTCFNQWTCMSDSCYITI